MVHLGDREGEALWAGWGNGIHDVHAGPAETVSLAFSFKDVRFTFTGRCVDGIPTGSYLLNDEPAQDAMFGKWVETDLLGCQRSPETSKGSPSPCRTVPVMALSPAPRHP